MTDVTTTGKQQKEAAQLSPADEQVLRELTARAREGGLGLTGEGGLLGKLAKMAIEGALEGEVDDHLGYLLGSPRMVCRLWPSAGRSSPTCCWTCVYPGRRALRWHADSA